MSIVDILTRQIPTRVKVVLLISEKLIYMIFIFKELWA